MSTITIAVLLTTYNRKQKTISCLESLQRQKLSEGVILNTFLTDDASSDGTAEAVKYTFPSVNIFRGSGSYFWAGGMRNSWKEALSSNADYYLLLNDDTVLTENAISILLGNSDMPRKKNQIPAICIGSTMDENTGKISYGGRGLNSRIIWSSGQLISSKIEYVPCDIANANIMLVPAEIVEKIGILSNTYTHGLADYDYTLRAKKAGFNVVVAPGFLGTCVDDHGKNWKSTNTTLKERIAYLKSPKGLAYKEYLQFIKDHFPLSYPSAFFKLWIKTFFPVVWDTFKKEG
jgi:GT2 family glycosyltransferase